MQQRTKHSCTPWHPDMGSSSCSAVLIQGRSGGSGIVVPTRHQSMGPRKLQARLTGMKQTTRHSCVTWHHFTITRQLPSLVQGPWGLSDMSGVLSVEDGPLPVGPLQGARHTTLSAENMCG